MRRTDAFFLFIILFFLTACREDPIPKPRGYFRIALPEQSYQLSDSIWPYQFAFPEYASFTPNTGQGAEPYWANIEIPMFKASIHLSYKRISDNLDQYTEDARSLAMKHIAKSTSIREIGISRPEADVYGIVYDIRGSEAASPLQFYVTDSSRHFLRGALYFHHQPNNDSLAPVIRFLEEEVYQLLKTLKWEDKPEA